MKRVAFAIIILYLISIFNSRAQVTIGTNTAPLKGSLLDLKQDDTAGGNSKKGLGLPRVALVDLEDLAPCVESATSTEKSQHIGLTVYNITDNSATMGTLKEGLYFWDGAAWQPFGVKNAQGYGPWYQVNDSTLPSRNVDTDSYLDAKAVIGGSNIINDATLSVHGSSNVSGESTTLTSTVTGNEAVGGTLDVAGSTTLSSTTIDVSNSTDSLIISDGQSSKKGKYLKAMDDIGTAKWANIGIGTVNGIFSTGITYTPGSQSGLDTGARITLPPGKWSIQCVLLFVCNSTSNTSLDKHWVQCGISRVDGGSVKYVGSKLVSGNVTKSGEYDIISGFFVIENNTESNLEYKFIITVNSLSSYGYSWSSGTVTCFSSNNSENSIIAFSLNN